MKRFYFVAILMFSLAAGNSCLAQWFPVYTDNNTEFYDAAFPTDNKVYVAASDSAGALVLRSSDGGLTWNKKYIPGWTYIDKVVMLDTLKGYLIKGGVPGKLLKTTDGFNTYTIKNTDTSFSVVSLCLLNDSTGYYLNNAARLRKFQHSGANITHVIDTLIDGQTLQFTNDHIAYLDNGIKLFKSTDTGLNWLAVNPNMGFSSVVFTFADSLNGYFSDGNQIQKTTDGGVTFSQAFSFPNAYSLAAGGNFCMVANDTGGIAYSSNGGINWQIESSFINVQSPAPYKVYRTPNNYCFLFSQYCGEIRKREQIVSGLQIINPETDFAVYPNPAINNFTVQFQKALDNASIIVTDLSGRPVVKLSRQSGKSITLSSALLSKGMYLITIFQKGEKFAVRKLQISE